MTEGGNYSIGQIEINTPKRHVHGVETYGLNKKERGKKRTKVSFLVDTLYFDGLANYYDGEGLVMNVAMYERREGVNHLCVNDERTIIETRKHKPKVVILTHFGKTMLRNKPWEIAKRLSEEKGVDGIAAHDGMEFELGNSHSRNKLQIINHKISQD